MAALAYNLTKPPSGGAGLPKPGQHAKPPKPAAAKAAGHRAAQAAPAQQTDWLAPMTPQQIAQQAAATVKSAYAPLYGQLSTQSKQLQAIHEKQAADNQYYQQWLDTKSAALSTAQAGVDQATQSLEQQLTGNQSSVFAGQSPALVSEANARAGNVSNNAQSNALTSDVAATQQPLRESLGGVAQESLGMERQAESQNLASQANAGAFLQAGRQKQNAAFGAAQQGLTSARTKLQGSQSSDLLKEVARLQGVQISVAQNNRAYQTAAQQLGLQAANIGSEIASRGAQVKIGQQNANTSATRANNEAKQNQFTQWLDTQKLNLDQKKYLLSVLNTNSEVAARDAKTKATLNGTANPLTQGQQNTLFDGVDSTQGELKSLISQGLSPQQAYQAAQRGYYIGTITEPSTTTRNGKTTTSTTTRNTKVTVTQVKNTGFLNAAFNLATQGALSPGDADYLRQFGLMPEKRYKVRSRTSQTTGNAAQKGAGAALKAISGLF